MAKRLFTGLLLFLVLSSSLGYIVAYRILHSQLESSFRERLIASGASLHYFSKCESQDFRWEKQQREFYYKGQLYDVIAIAGQGDDIRYVCVADEEEAALEKKYGQAFGWQLTPATQKKIASVYQMLFSFQSCCEPAVFTFSGHSSSLEWQDLVADIAAGIKQKTIHPPRPEFQLNPLIG